MALNSAQVELFFNGSKKLETNTSGITTTGTVNVNGAYTLPTTDGTNGQVLTTDGSGAVTFADAVADGDAPCEATVMPWIAAACAVETGAFAPVLAESTFPVAVTVLTIRSPSLSHLYAVVAAI